MYLYGYISGESGPEPLTLMHIYIIYLFRCRGGLTFAARALLGRLVNNRPFSLRVRPGPEASEIAVSSRQDG